MSRRRNKYYDRKLKLQAVQDYLGGGGSLRTICKKHGIKDKKQLRNWIKWYNGHKEIKERRAAGTEIYMTKGRKTTEKVRANSRFSSALAFLSSIYASLLCGCCVASVINPGIPMRLDFLVDGV